MPASHRPDVSVEPVELDSKSAPNFHRCRAIETLKELQIQLHAKELELIQAQTEAEKANVQISSLGKIRKELKWRKNEATKNQKEIQELKSQSEELNRELSLRTQNYEALRKNYIALKHESSYLIECKRNDHKAIMEMEHERKKQCSYLEEYIRSSESKLLNARLFIFGLGSLALLLYLCKWPTKPAPKLEQAQSAFYFWRI